MAGSVFGRTAIVTAKPSNRRLELLWAWASVLVLILCWDVALRLDQSTPLPGMHMHESAGLEHPAQMVRLGKYQ
jgi:hypothetical protein